MKGRSPARTPDQINSLGELLRYLREREGIPLRELAQRVGYHYSYLSRLEKNERKADQRTLMTLFVPALGLSDEPEWTRRLLELAGVHEPAAPVSTKAPVPTGTDGDPAYSPLPVGITQLLGREKELEALQRRLLQNNARLITLVGAPGVGKTRLALETARRIQSHYAHGALFIDLTRIERPGELLPALRDALGISEVTERQLFLHLVHTMKAKNLLLVLDNFEHVLDSAPQVVQVLGNSPKVQALVTSREALNVPGELEYPVRPLPLPEHENEAIESFAAIQLFLQRAQAVQPGFELSAGNRRAVLEICRMLDGLPLAIELTAPRVRALSAQAILKQFERRLDWSARSAHFSQQTLRSALDWSYNLLSEKAQLLLQRLSVFSGGWSLEAVEAVCVDEEEIPGLPALRPEDVLEKLLQLVDKSMVISEFQEAEPRYRSLETIRHFGREKLVLKKEWERYRSRHLIFFADFAGNIETSFNLEIQQNWIRPVELEHSNLTAALDWGLLHRPALEDGLRLAAAVAPLWIRRSRFREGLAYCKTYLDHCSSPEHQSMRTKLLTYAGAMANYLYDYQTAYELSSESVALSRTLPEPDHLARALYYFGEACYDGGRTGEARIALEECLALCTQPVNQKQYGLALSLLGLVQCEEGDFTSAVETEQDALAAAETTGDLWLRSRTMLNLGSIHRYQGETDTAIRWFEQSLELAVALGDRSSEGFSCANLAILHHLENDYAKSASWAERAFTVFQSLGDEIQLPFPLRMMAYAAIQAGNLTRARILIRESLAGNRALGHESGQLACLVAAAGCLLAETAYTGAAALCALVRSAAETNRIALLEPDRKTVQDILETSRSTLGEEGFQSAQRLGEEMNLEEAIREWLKPETDPLHATPE